MDQNLLLLAAVPVIDAALAVDLDEALLNRTIGVLMLVMLGVMLLWPRRWLEAHATVTPAGYWLQAPIFFGIGIYGAHLAVEKGAPFVRRALVVILLSSSIALLTDWRP